MSSDITENRCWQRESIDARPLLSVQESEELEALFKILANQTRLRILHALTRAGEMCVTHLVDTLGIKPQAISNHLQRLVDRGMLASRRKGSNIFYKIIDPCVVNLRGSGLCLMEEAKEYSRLGRPSPTPVVHSAGELWNVSKSSD